MPPHRSGRSSSRRNTPVSPPKPAAHTSPPRQTRRSTRSAGHEAEPLQSHHQTATLQPVQEEVEDADATQVMDEDCTDFSDAASDDSSDSQGESDALDLDSIVENLPDLYHDSSKILNAITHSNQVHFMKRYDEMQDQNSSSRKRLKRLMERYSIVREVYGDRVYIKPAVIIRKVTKGAPWKDTKEGPWRPDAILFLANLADFLATVCFGSDDQIGDAISYMFNNYPEPFSTLDPLSRFRTEKLLETFNFGLELRTQVVIRTCFSRWQSPEFDPDMILREVFVNEAETTFRAETEATTDIGFENATVERMREIKTFFCTDSRKSVDLPTLRTRYPWRVFVSQLGIYANLRREELQNQVEEGGGADHIVKLIRAADFLAGTKVVLMNFTAKVSDVAEEGAPEKAVVFPANEDPQPAVPGIRAARALTNVDKKKNIVRLKELKAQTVARKSLSSDVTTTETLARDHEIPQSPVEVEEEVHVSAVEDFAPAVMSDDEPLLPLSTLSRIVPTQQTKVVLDVLRAHSEQSNKENLERTVTASKRSFMDRQENARRILFDDSEDERPASPPKRRRLPDPEGSEDDAFEEDIRLPKTSRNESGKYQASPNWRTGETSSHERFPDRAEIERPLSSTLQARRVIPSSQPARLPLQEKHDDQLPPSSAAVRPQPTVPDSPPQSQSLSQQHAAVNKAAKQMVRVSRALTQGQDMKPRKGYSADEVERLMTLVKLYGTQWSKILVEDNDRGSFRDGPKLQGRSQGQLKDKARNIKLDYLKAGNDLPEGFIGVTIGHRHVEILRQRGIQFVEGDERGYPLDARGNLLRSD